MKVIPWKSKSCTRSLHQVLHIKLRCSRTFVPKRPWDINLRKPLTTNPTIELRSQKAACSKNRHRIQPKMMKSPLSLVCSDCIVRKRHYVGQDSSSHVSKHWHHPKPKMLKSTLSSVSSNHIAHKRNLLAI